MKWQARCPKCHNSHFHVVGETDLEVDPHMPTLPRVLCAVCYTDIGSATITDPIR